MFLGVQYTFGESSLIAGLSPPDFDALMISRKQIPLFSLATF